MSKHAWKLSGLSSLLWSIRLPVAIVRPACAKMSSSGENRDSSGDQRHVTNDEETQQYSNISEVVSDHEDGREYGCEENSLSREQDTARRRPESPTTWYSDDTEHTVDTHPGTARFELFCTPCQRPHPQRVSRATNKSVLSHRNHVNQLPNADELARTCFNPLNSPREHPPPASRAWTNVTARDLASKGPTTIARDLVHSLRQQHQPPRSPSADSELDFDQLSDYSDSAEHSREGHQRAPQHHLAVTKIFSASSLQPFGPLIVRHSLWPDHRLEIVPGYYTQSPLPDVLPLSQRLRLLQRPVARPIPCVSEEYILRTGTFATSTSKSPSEQRAPIASSHEESSQTGEPDSPSPSR